MTSTTKAREVVPRVRPRGGGRARRRDGGKDGMRGQRDRGGKEQAKTCDGALQALYMDARKELQNDVSWKVAIEGSDGMH